MKKIKYLLLPFLLLQLFIVTAAEKNFIFTEGSWDLNDFIQVKSPRWAHLGTWEQEKDHIWNTVPKDASEAEMLSKRAGETYSSLLWKEKIADAKIIEISSEMSFDHRMAPLLVIAPEIGEDANGSPEYREHWEIVLYDKGLNVWHHMFDNGKPHWYKAASILQDFPAKEKIKVTVIIKLNGKVPSIEVKAGNHNLHYAELALPKSFYVGFTGCEGINRFYDFKVKYK